jgi:NAD(P)-dependent dehydrogenase (short-subunit alcohol dehydrogenase family)
MMRLNDRVAIVTGASKGIGSAIAVALASEGAKVVLAARNEAGLRETGRRIGDAERWHAVKTDVTSEHDVAEMVRQTVKQFGTIHILVNNAGIAGPTALCEDVKLAEWEETMAVNLRGPFLCAKAVLPVMKAQRWGRIVNISSITGKRPLSMRTPYASSKLGLIGFTRTLAAEVGPFEVTVNAICPGATKGPRIDAVIKNLAQAEGKSEEEIATRFLQDAALRRFVEADDVASLAVFLASDAGRNMTGQDFNVSAGLVMY